MNTLKTLLIALVMLSVAQVFAARESGGRLAPSAVEIEFNSLGAGIDTELVRQVEELVNHYEEQGWLRGKKIEQRGREGELKVCLQFKTWTDALRADEEIQELIGASDKGITTSKPTLSCDPIVIPPNV